MTDKEIIIDGVNVAGCEYLTENLLCNQANLLDFHCVANQNCNYKQLQRTQQQYNAVVEQNRQLQEAIKAKEQECKLLKGALKDRNIVAVVEEHEKLKRVLNKIEQIANTYTTVQCLNPDFDCNNCYDDITDNGTTCINKGRQEILAVINEVKE